MLGALHGAQQQDSSERKSVSACHQKRRGVSIHLAVHRFLLLTILTPLALSSGSVCDFQADFFPAQCQAINPLGNTGDNREGTQESEEDERVQWYHGSHIEATTNLAYAAASRGFSGYGLL